MSDEQKPIFYQYRTRPTTDDKYPWSAWRECHESIYKYFLKVPVLNDWAYEVRALYTLPNPDVVKQLVEALKAAGLFVHHCWCDVSMNEYSSKKLDETMEKIDSALLAAREAGL